MGGVRIFVSHSSADGDFGLQLIDDLCMKFPDPDAIWYDQAGGIWAGDEWWNKIVDEITSRDVFLVILSPDAMASKWVQAEIAMAWNQRVTSGKRILPVLYRPASIRADLATLDIISFEKAAVRVAYNAALDELVAAINQGRQADALAASPASAQPNDQVPQTVPNAHAPTVSLKAHALIVSSADPSSHPANSPVPQQTAASSSLNMLASIATLDGIELTMSQFTSFSSAKKSLRDKDYEIVHFIIQDGTPSASDATQAPDEAPEAQQQMSRSPYDHVWGVLELGLPPTTVRLLIFDGYGDDVAVDRLIIFAPYSMSIPARASGNRTVQRFVREFYASFAQSHSVERAFKEAQMIAGGTSSPDLSSIHLHSRAQRGSDGALLLTLWVNDLSDPLIIDLAAVESALDTIGMPREQLLDMMIRKLKVHGWIFAPPRENAIVPMSSMVIGVFSWDTGATTIRCTQLFRVDNTLDPQHWSAWCRLLVAYNDLCGDEYRSLKHPADPSAKFTLQRSVARSKRSYASLQSPIDTLVVHGFPQAALSFALANAFLDQAETRLIEDELSKTVSFLESALTSLHDIITECMPQNSH